MRLQDYLIDKPILTTDRLTLRALRASDADDLGAWTRDPALYRYWGKGMSKADRTPSLLFERAAKPTKSFHWGIVYNVSNAVIGEAWVYLIENDRMAKLAFRVAAKYHGCGIATEAVGRIVRFCFDDTELQRLWTDVDVRNEASVRVLEKCGFTREGTVRQGKMVSSWCDYHLYGLLKEDVVAQERQIDA